MKEQYLENELQELKAEISAIEESEQAEQALNTANDISDDSGNEQDDILSEIHRQIEHGLPLNDEIKRQLKLLVKEVETQFETLPKKACLTIFTAGIVLGKVLK